MAGGVVWLKDSAQFGGCQGWGTFTGFREVAFWVPWSGALRELPQAKFKGCACVLDSGPNLPVGFLWQTKF